MSELTKGERNDLLKLARMRERVAKAEVDQRAAELLADVEAQLSAQYKFSDDAWAEVTTAASAACQAADVEVARICRERGIPDEFRPGINASWYSRGENGMSKRRTELRVAAKARIDAEAKRARHAIAVASVNVQTELLATGMTTDAARDFLATMPTPEELMPTLHLAELEGGAK